jgi:hypothetical protein
MSSYGEVPRLPSAASSRSVVTPGLIPSFGTLNGHNAGTAQRRSHQFSDESSAPEEAWSDRELDLLESVRKTSVVLPLYLVSYVDPDIYSFCSIPCDPYPRPIRLVLSLLPLPWMS